MAEGLDYWTICETEMPLIVEALGYEVIERELAYLEVLWKS